MYNICVQLVRKLGILTWAYGGHIYTAYSPTYTSLYVGGQNHSDYTHTIHSVTQVLSIGAFHPRPLLKPDFFTVSTAPTIRTKR